ncbi:MAG: fumarate hydratase, partial [Woeseiaceae bacterium]
MKDAWIEQAAYEAHRLAATTHPADVRAALEGVHERERNELPRYVMKAIVDNSRVAEADQRPICADVGVIRVFVVAGNEARIEGGFVALEQAIRRATVRVTKDLALRSNRVHPINRSNPGNNLGIFAPNLDYRFEP